MIHPDIQQALARERSGTFVAEAEAERACEEGIRRFTALVAADNTAMAGLLRNYGAGLVGYGHGALEYEIELACAARPDGTTATPS